ncbi:hypothetical protein DKX38_008383 [Salix brachista]|uniref:Uncharacterized protein n=1 Tax=Salix brachista TaxID=2182728 RepID=A0A5N5MQV0_9ROSI|nr:hypothetical protein DKX38_008383 [Salix brachista]
MEKISSSPSFPRIANQIFLELSTPAMSDSGCPTINYHEMYANGKVGWILVVQKGEHASGSSKEVSIPPLSTYHISPIEFSMVEQLQGAHIGGFLGILGGTFIIRQHESNEVNKKLMPSVCYQNVLHFLEESSTPVVPFSVIEYVRTRQRGIFTSPRAEEVEGLETIKRTVVETLGPTAQLSSALLVCVPKASIRRQRLLPPRSPRTHPRSEVPFLNLLNCSFIFKTACVYWIDQITFSSNLLRGIQQPTSIFIIKENNLGSDAPLMNLDRNCAQLKNAQALESALGKFNLGYCMMELELRFAQICDIAIGGQELGLSFVLEQGKQKAKWEKEGIHQKVGRC